MLQVKKKNKKKEKETDKNCKRIRLRPFWIIYPIKLVGTNHKKELKLFLWKVLNEILATWYLVNGRNYQIPQNYAFCKKGSWIFPALVPAVWVFTIQNYSGLVQIWRSELNLFSHKTYFSGTKAFLQIISILMKWLILFVKSHTSFIVVSGMRGIKRFFMQIIFILFRNSAGQIWVYLTQSRPISIRDPHLTRPFGPPLLFFGCP